MLSKQIYLLSVCRFDRQQKGCYEREAGRMTISELLERAGGLL